MKTRAALYAKLISLFILLAIPFFVASAQSGRVDQSPRPIPGPEPQAISPAVPDRKTSFVVDSSGDKYKLVFPTSRQGSLRVKYSEVAPAVRSRNLSFIEELNKSSAQGYRLISAVDLEPVGIVMFDEGQYEYSGFETTSDLFFATNDLDGKYATLARQGFRMVERLSGYYVTSTHMGRDSTETTEFFLLEREKGIERATRPILVSRPPRWRGNPAGEMSAQVNEKLADGYYPSIVLSKYEIVLEQTKRGEEFLANRPQLLVVRSKWRDKVEKKTNESAQQGYRLALVSYAITVMYRNPDTVTPVSYVWLDAKKNVFEKQLARLQASGAIYRMTYPNRDGNETKLIFEQKAVDDGTRREYKVLKFEFQEMEDPATKKVLIDLTPESKETVKQMNSLVRQGFVVRDLFMSDKVSVLLESSR